MKDVIFLGSSKSDLQAFPDNARREAGFQLFRVQEGKHPADAKPMKIVGKGVFEIRIHEEGQAHRVFYVAKFEEAVYVLHAFEKKTRKTARKDLEIGQRRYRELIRQRG